jgi:hypothetical protein
MPESCHRMYCGSLGLGVFQVAKETITLVPDSQLESIKDELNRKIFTGLQYL